MNNSFVYAQAGKLAERVYPKRMTQRALPRRTGCCYGRAPTAAELQAGLDFLKTHAGEARLSGKPGTLTAWKQYSRVLFSSNEFEFLN